MKTPEERGRYGRWLVAAHLARGIKTAEDARKALAADGINIGTSTYAAYESGGKVPSKPHMPELERFWGPMPDETAPLTGQGDLVAAISALIEEMRLSRVQQDESTRVLLEAMAAVVSAQEPRGTRAGRGHEAPADTARS